MADATLDVAPFYAVGTTLNAYSFGVYVDNPDGIAPPASAGSAVVASNGTVTFTGLAAGARFYAGTGVDPYQYIGFSTARAATVVAPSGVTMVAATDDSTLLTSTLVTYTDGNSITVPVVAGGLLNVLLRATIKQITGFLEVTFNDSGPTVLGPFQVMTQATATYTPTRTTEAAVAGRSLNSVPVIGGGFIALEVPAGASSAIVRTKWKATVEATQGGAQLRRLYGYSLGL